MRSYLLISASLVNVFAVATVASAAELPFRLATVSEANSLTQASVIATPLNQTDFNTAATVTVKKLSSGAVSSTQRASHGISAVYKAAISAGTDPSPHVVPPAVAPTDFVYYEDNHDSVQAWATMNATGVPFVMVYADGKTQGQSAASWSTKYLVPGTGNRDVYARFTIPAVKFSGRWEDAAPSLSRGRARIDFLVDAYPAWSTEAVRFNEKNASNGDTIHVDTFGYSIGLEGYSQGMSAQNLSSTSQVVTVKLGTYPAGKIFDLTLLFQAEGKLDSACVQTSEFECGSVSVKIEWEPNAPQPVLYSKPAP